MDNGVYNRKLFSKKASEARDKLREMGGIAPQQQMPQMPKGPGGILASSPELMQAAMRRSPVLPTTQPMPGQPPMPMQPAPEPKMLPPSQPIPNIAGIPMPNQPPKGRPAPAPQGQAPRPMAPAPRPMAPGPAPQQAPAPQQPQKPVVRMAEGGLLGQVGDIPSRMNESLTDMGMAFGRAIGVFQKAVTTKDPAELGLPAEIQEEVKKVGADDPTKTGQEVVDDMLPDEEKSGDLKTDLTKVANNIGITEIPAEAEIDALNKAIAGATLGAALAGSYVNPNTGQELRPTAGARIGSAVAQGLALQRDTETRRAKTEAELMLAREKAKTSAKPAKLTPAQEQLVELFAKRAETEDPSAVAKKFNEEFGPGVGDMVLEFYRSGSGITGGTPGQPTEEPTGGFKVGQTATGPNGEKVQWDGSSWQPI